MIFQKDALPDMAALLLHGILHSVFPVSTYEAN
jgi:hypothetical protein